jgi:hypothetical protein
MRKPYSIGHLTKQELRSSVNVVNDCWEWKYSLAGGGYGTLRRHGRSWPVHRLSYFMFKRNAPLAVLSDDTVHVCHKCDNRKCINPGHLFIGNASINAADKVAKDRHNRGERVWKAKLTADDVLKIRALHKRGIKNADIAREYRVDKSAISAIVTRRNWKHI